MPRKSAASLAIPRVAGGPARLTAPAWLGEEETVVFRDLVSSVDPRHFVRSDLPLLCTYAEAFALARRSAKELRVGIVVNGKTNPWLVAREKSVRELVALSARLRLAPQARSGGDSKTVGRRANGSTSAYDALGEDQR